MFDSLKSLNANAVNFEKRLVDVEDVVSILRTEEESNRRRTLVNSPDTLTQHHSAALHESVKKIEHRDRKHNVVLYGMQVKPRDDPYELTEQLFKSLNIPIQEIRDVIVLKGRASSLLKVTLYSLRFQSLLLKQAKSLRKRKDEFSEVYVNPDLTFEERRLNKMHRDKIREFRRQYPDHNIKIYAYLGEIIMRPPNGDVITLWREGNNGLGPETEPGGATTAAPTTPAMRNVDVRPRGRSTNTQYSDIGFHQI